MIDRIVIAQTSLVALWVVALSSTISCDGDAFDTNGVLTRAEFRCLAVSESMRTIAPARLERKRVQTARIDRLLGLELDILDRAKLLSERAVLAQEIAFYLSCTNNIFSDNDYKNLQTTYIL